MSLNIKNERVRELARRAAAVTGKSQTAAIEEALVRLLDAYDADPAKADLAWRRERLLAIGREWRAREHDSVMEVEDLYDPETGLPA